jgi:hypothetical protein
MCDIVVHNITGDVLEIVPDGSGSADGNHRVVKVPYAPELVFEKLLLPGHEHVGDEREPLHRRFYLEPRMLSADGASSTIDFVREITTYRDHL